jgi:hypothetical protein
MSRELSNALQDLLAKRNALEMDPNGLGVEIAFTDAGGVRWHRDSLGKLQEVPDSFDFDEADERLVGRLVPVRSNDIVDPVRGSDVISDTVSTIGSVPDEF